MSFLLVPNHNLMMITMNLLGSFAIDGEGFFEIFYRFNIKLEKTLEIIQIVVETKASEILIFLTILLHKLQVTS